MQAMRDGEGDEEEDDDAGEPPVVVLGGAAMWDRPPPDLDATDAAAADSMELEWVTRTVTYELGMRTRAALLRQLRVDLPRSVVVVRGQPTKDAREVLRWACEPRMCTQAALATPVEFLLRAGLLAHEPAAPEPMRVVVEASGQVHVEKWMEWTPLPTTGLLRAGAPPRGRVRITVAADARAVVVGLELRRTRRAP